jgi:hypothetical protein
LLLVDTHRVEITGAEEDPADADDERSTGEEDSNAGDGGGEEPEKDELEGLAIAQHIRKLMSRGVEPDDIAVLGRTHWICKHVASALDTHGILHTLSDNQGFLATPELLLLDALVSLLDNAAQDIPLSAVMRSGCTGTRPVPGGRAQGFSEADLLRIRWIPTQRCRAAKHQGRSFTRQSPGTLNRDLIPHFEARFPASVVAGRDPCARTLPAVERVVCDCVRTIRLSGIYQSTSGWN